jgi:hypothetical protein
VTWVWVLGGLGVFVALIAPFLLATPADFDDPDWP